MNIGYEHLISDNWIRILGWIPVRPGDRVLIAADPNFPMKPDLPWVYETESLSHIEEIQPELYDYIILTDISYLSRIDLCKFLEVARKRMRRTGKLCLISQNRLSFRRWNGVRIPGEENFLIARNSETEKIPYTRRELIEAVGRNWTATFFYLAPTFEFTTDIWSDRRLPDKSGYLEDTFYYGYDRVRFHHDYDVLGAVIDEGLYPEMADAFLMLLSVSSMHRDLPDMVHYSIRRRDSLQMVTEIRGRRVIKRPLRKKAKKHLLNIKEAYSELSKRYDRTSVRWNKIIKFDGGRARFEFIKGETLENYLDRLLKAGKEEEIISQIQRYYNCFTDGQKIERFARSEEFESIFGRISKEEQDLLSGMDSLQITDVDCIFGNALIRKDAFEITDYEWTFHFPIPFEFVKWRCIHYYLNYREARKAALGDKLYDYFGIDTKRQALYNRMERSFQLYVMGQNSSYQQSLNDRGSVLNAELLSERWNYLINGGRGRLYFDRGIGFSEGDSIETEPQRVNDNSWCIVVNTDPNVKRLRIDPSATNGLIILYNLTADQTDLIEDESGRIEFLNMKELSIGGRERAFLTEQRDPQIILSDAGNRNIYLEYRFFSFVEAEYDRDPLEILNSGMVEGNPIH